MKSFTTIFTSSANPYVSFLLPTWNSGSFDHSFETSRLLRDYAVWEFNAFLWITLISITFLLTQKFFKLFKLWNQACKIPGPPCPSFYGHFSSINKQNLTEVLSDSHEEYGSVVKLWLSPTQLLVSIKDPELIREMLYKAKDKLPLTGKALHLAFGPSSLFASSFDKVEKRRESLASELNGRLHERANVIPTKATGCIIEKLNNVICKGSIDCKTVSQHMAFTFLGATLFGDKFLDWSEANIYEELLMMVAKDACFWASYNVTPFWKQGYWRYQQSCAKLKCLTQVFIQRFGKNYKLFHHMDSISYNRTANAGIESTVGLKSCSGLFLPNSSSVQELNDHPSEREEPCGNIMGMMSHGCIMTTGLINNTLLRLVTHPEMQNKIYSEIIMARKGAGARDQPNVDKMPLLLATIYESARLMPSGPLLQRCSIKHDLRLKSGLVIPAGALLLVPIQLVQMDDLSWGYDAGKFNPYRFLSTSEKISSSQNKPISTAGLVGEHLNQQPGSFVLKDPNATAAFLPFGSGARACICQKFVVQGIATLFASLVEQFEVKLQPGSKTSSKPTPNNSIILDFPSPEISFVRRNA